MNTTSEPDSARVPDDILPAVRRFAFRVAGPRDLLINVVINGTIAWFLYCSRDSVPLVGPGSVFDMLVPMTFIETTATTFFGLLNGTIEYRKRAVAGAATMPALTVLSRMRWFGLASFEAGICGSLALASILAIREIATVIAVGQETSGLASTVGIAAYSGLLACVAHSRAVISGSRLACQYH